MSEVALAAQGLTFGYRSEPVLSAIDLAIPTGSLGALLGPNGSGKSTLLKLLVGRLTPWSGSVTLGDRPLARWTAIERARQIGYLPQAVATSYDFTVAEVVLMGRHPHRAFGLETAADLEIVQGCLARTATDPLADRIFNTLSGGERQRVLLASVLAQEPAILLLDEPTTALDIHHQHEVMELLGGLHGEGLTILMVTHDLNLAARYCPTLWLLHDGAVVASGPPTEVLVESRLTQVYGPRLRVAVDPDMGGPLVLPPLPGGGQ